MSAASLARFTPAGELVWYVDEDVSYYVLATDASDRIYAANQTGSLMLRRFGSDGAAQLDVPIEARSIDLSARSALVGIGGIWERSVTVGGRTVRSSYTGSSGVWISIMEAP
jgi:hypothetical protein